MTEPNRPRSLYAYVGRLAIIAPRELIQSCAEGLSDPAPGSREEKDV